MDQAASSSTRSAMEVQLKWLIKAINYENDAATKEIKKSSHEGFTEVRTKLDSVYFFVSKRVPALVQLCKSLHQSAPSPRLGMFKFVDVFVTSECIHLYILCIVPRCFYRELFVM